MGEREQRFSNNQITFVNQSECCFCLDRRLEDGNQMMAFIKEYFHLTKKNKKGLTKNSPMQGAVTTTAYQSSRTQLVYSKTQDLIPSSLKPSNTKGNTPLY